VQLLVKDDKGKMDNTVLHSAGMFMQVTLVGETPELGQQIKERSGNSNSSVFSGPRVSSLHCLRDLDENEGAFFVFPNLSVRLEGNFQLKFDLFNVKDGSTKWLGSITSGMFTSYSYHTFPGSEASTPLMLLFIDQGVKVPFRKRFRGSNPPKHLTVKKFGKKATAESEEKRGKGAGKRKGAGAVGHKQKRRKRSNDSEDSEDFSDSNNESDEEGSEAEGEGSSSDKDQNLIKPAKASKLSPLISTVPLNSNITSAPTPTSPSTLASTSNSAQASTPTISASSPTSSHPVINSDQPITVINQQFSLSQPDKSSQRSSPSSHQSTVTPTTLSTSPVSIVISASHHENAPNYPKVSSTDHKYLPLSPESSPTIADLPNLGSNNSNSNSNSTSNSNNNHNSDRKNNHNNNHNNNRNNNNNLNNNQNMMPLPLFMSPEQAQMHFYLYQNLNYAAAMPHMGFPPMMCSPFPMIAPVYHMPMAFFHPEAYRQWASAATAAAAMQHQSRMMIPTTPPETSAIPDRPESNRSNPGLDENNVSLLLHAAAMNPQDQKATRERQPSLSPSLLHQPQPSASNKANSTLRKPQVKSQPESSINLPSFKDLLTTLNPIVKESSQLLKEVQLL